MKNLFVVNGASGTGKSVLVRFVASTYVDIALLRKHTTRPQRDCEKGKDWAPDLYFVSDKEFERLALDYQYTFRGYRYGFSRKRLDSFLSQNMSVIAIVRSADVIGKLLDDYGSINVVPVFVHADPDKIRERLLRQDLSEERLRFRLRWIRSVFQDYLAHSSIYREVILNNSSRQDYHRLIAQCFSRYGASPDTAEAPGLSDPSAYKVGSHTSALDLETKLLRELQGPLRTDAGVGPRYTQ